MVSNRDESACDRVQRDRDDDRIVGHRIRKVHEPVGFHPNVIDDVIGEEEVDPQIEHQCNDAGDHVDG